LVDNDGNSVNHFVYDSFGNVVSESDTVLSRYLFTGREWDDESGLQYNRARYYDPEAGRFIGEDPIGFSAGTANLYGYVENNPINAVDPFGTSSQALLDGVATANGQETTLDV
jgi:RHS repeat-associated protein